MCTGTSPEPPIKNAENSKGPSIKRKTLGHVQLSSSTLNNLAALSNELSNLLVLVWQQAQSVSDIVPLPLTLSPCQPGSQLASELLGVLVLHVLLAVVGIRRKQTMLTFSMNEARNLMIRLKRSSSKPSSDESKLNISTKWL